MAAQEPTDYWSTVEEIGELRLGADMSILVKRGVRKKDNRELVSIRGRAAGKPSIGFDLPVSVAEQFYSILARALNKT